MSLPSFVGEPMTYTPLVPLIFDSAGKSMIIVNTKCSYVIVYFIDLFSL